MAMKDLADDLGARREKALAMGGAEAIGKQHGEGKLTVRERVERLFDPGSFQEIGLLANHANISPAMKGKDTPADGVVTGFGKINGRPASLIAYDFTVMAGSMGRTAEVKCNRAREIALTKRMPMIWLIDSAGARIQEAIGSPLSGSGVLFWEESIMSEGGPGPRRHRLHPRAFRLRADGEGDQPHGAGRPAPREGGGGRGRHAGGAGRVQGPHRDLGRRRPRCGGRRPLPRGGQGLSVLLSLVHPRVPPDRAVRRPR